MHCRVPGPPRTAAAGASHQRPRGTPASAQLARSIAAGQRASGRPRCDSVAVVLPKLGARRPICTWWAIHAADAHRPRGMGSVFGTNSREQRGERTNWPPLTRPTVRGLAVVGSSANAEGRKNCRAARRSGTSRRRPSPTGHWAAARAFGALCRAAVRRAATRKFTTLYPSPAFVTPRLVRGHHRFAMTPSANPLFILPRLCLGPPTPLDQVLPPR